MCLKFDMKCLAQHHRDPQKENRLPSKFRPGSGPTWSDIRLDKASTYGPFAELICGQPRKLKYFCSLDQLHYRAAPLADRETGIIPV